MKPNRRHKHLVIRLSSEEHAEIVHLAQSAGLSTSHYVRTIAVNGQILSPPLLREITKSLCQLQIDLKNKSPTTIHQQLKYVLACLEVGKEETQNDNFKSST